MTTSVLGDAGNTPTHIGVHGQPLIDKITITLPYPNSAYKDSVLHGGSQDYNTTFQQAVYDAVNDGNVFKPAQWRGYKLAYCLSLKETYSKPLIQIFPKETSWAHVARVEFNPTKLGAAGLEELGFTLGMLFFGDLDYVWKHGRVTRLDVAIDLHNVTLSELHFLKSWGTTQKSFSQDGQIETVYLGKSTSQQTKIYDKCAQLGIQGTQPVTRIERQLKLNSSLHKITDVSFPFKHLTLVENWPKAPDGIEPWLWGMIADSIEVRGPVATLANLPNDLQKKALKAIKQETSSVWQPELFWSHWPNVVSQFSKCLAAKSF